jgi:D-xylose reductase
MFDSAHSHSLPDGSQFPSIGLGTWKIPDGLTPGIVRDSIEIGYRHFDCACDYGNEPAVGKGLRAALKEGLCGRDDLWVTSKLWNTYHDARHVREACERSLHDLGMDELDLYLVHFPIALAYVPFAERYPPGWFHDPAAESPAMKPVDVPYAETWGAMEELQRAGLVKRIGVCNLNISLLRDLLTTCEIRPAVHQVEMHPYLTQPKLLRYCQNEGIAVTAFSPFGAGSYVPLGMAESEDSVLVDPAVTGIAAAHDVSAARVVLRWAVQRGTVAIPKSQSPEHLRENLDVFSISLSDTEMAAIDGLDRHQRYNDPGVFCEAAFNTFYPIFD